MYDQKNILGHKSSMTKQSDEIFEWEDQKQIYYYSNFSFFDNQKDQNTFYQYSLFMQKVSNQLVKEWKTEANKIFAPYATSREVFMNLLEIWLHHHPITNLYENKRNTQFKFNQTYAQEFVERMKQDITRKHGNVNLKLHQVSIKAVCIGFFMTSNEVWQEMFQSQSISKTKDFFSDNPLIQGVTKTIEKTFKPVMIVSEKISSVFGRKKIKKNEQVPAQDCDHLKFEDCFQEFQKTLDIERQVERKMSGLNLNEFEEYDQKDKKKIISSKSFEEHESPFQNKLMSSVYDYLTNFLKVNSPWEVANTFVTNILEMNYLKTEQGTKVKVLKPAQDFYEKLVFVWLLLKNEKQQIKFQEYLNVVKSKFNDMWREKYIIPTKYFFQRINKDWSEIRSQTGHIEQDVSLKNKQILGSLLKRIRKGMKNEWDKKIKLSTKRNWKSQESIGRSSEFYKENLKRQRNFVDY